MAVVVIDTIKPKNNGTFPVVEAVDVKVTNDQRLDAALNAKANQSDLNALSSTVAGKQNALTTEQLAAANSGITSALVTQIGTNTTAIAGKASTADLAETNAAVALKANTSDVNTALASKSDTSTVTGIATRVGAVESEQASLSSRMDSFTALSEGSTTGDAELIDIRTGANGKIYNNAGTAVRSQVNDLDSKISTIIPNQHNAIVTDKQVTNLINKYNLISDKYVDTTGAEQTSSAFAVTPFIEVAAGDTLYGANIGLSCFYSASREFISNVSSWSSAVTVPANAKYIRVDIPTASIDYAILALNNLPSKNDNGMVKISSSDFDELITLAESDVLGKINDINAESTVVTTTKPTNLIKEKILINGKYVDTNGVEKTSASFAVTPYIEVTEGGTLYGSNIGLSCFYNAGKTFISSVSDWSSAVTVPENAKYIRVNIPVASVNYAILSDIGSLPNYNDHGIITLGKNKRYTYDWTVFTVPVNQAIVGTADTGSSIADSESDIVNVSCAIKLPPSYTPYGKPTKLIMICHGAGRGITIPPPTPEGAKAWKDMANYNNICNAFLNAGYAVFDCDGYADTYSSCNFWGASKGVEAWRKAYDYIVSNYNVEENFSIYGFSMGGLTAMHLALNGFPNIKCIALSSPVLDLEKCWEDGQTYAFINAYGMTDHYDPDKARGCDPMQRLITINNTEYCLAVLPPIKMWYGSTEEGTAVNKTYAERYVNALVASGQYAIYREVAGAGHEICYGENAMCIQEYLYWIDRFNNKE